MALTIFETLTDGTQKAQLTDGTDVVGISTIGGTKALKVDVLQIPGGTGPSTSTLTSIVASVASVSLLAANSNRKRFILYNSTTKPVNIAFAAAASATAFTLVVPNGALYESDDPTYTGAVSAIWTAAATGNIHVTELI